MLQQVIQSPPRRRVRRHTLQELQHYERLERLQCAYRVQGRASFGSAPNDNLISGGGGPPYDPLSESSPLIWLDMQDAGTLTTGGGGTTVIGLVNKVSSVDWTETTFPPGYAATGLFGQPCMVFNGSNTRLMSTEAAVPTALSHTAGQAPNPYTLFIVGNVDVADALRTMFSVCNSGDNLARLVWGTNTTAVGRWTAQAVNDAGTGTGASADSSATVDLSDHIHMWRTTGTALSMQLDNGAADPSAFAQDVSVGSTVALTLNRSALGVRCNLTQNQFGDGDIGELLLYGADLDSSARQRVYDYLAGKWP